VARVAAVARAAVSPAAAGPQRPAGQHTVRQHNLALVLQRIASDGPLSRARIASLSGLTRATVSSLVDELLQASLVTELGPRNRGAVGRPGSALALNRSSYAGLGLEVNVDYVAVCVADLAGGVRYLRTRRGDNRRLSPGRVLSRAVGMARAASRAAEADGLTVAGLAIALPGLVEAERGLLRLAPNLGWVDVRVVDFLAARLEPGSLPIVVDNEANLAALGELWFGGHQGLSDFVHVSGEIGVGAGIVVGRELFRGVMGFAGEVGHVTVQADGPPCRCGSRGCLEQVAGQEAIMRAAGLSGEAGTSVGQPRGSVAELLARARAGEARTLQAIEAAGRALGIAVAAVVNLVDTTTVVLGGLYTPLQPWLRAPFAEELQVRVIGRRWSRVRVLTSRLGPDAAVRGAAGAVVKEILSNPAAVRVGKGTVLST
jgi:predicted NBD/HSP70 family sugar kinase